MRGYPSLAAMASSRDSGTQPFDVRLSEVDPRPATVPGPAQAGDPSKVHLRSREPI
ncbi:hypothetical protein FA95DRAFT_1561367 [Auriscalpium vulgare]|uniref:Uncharacterized protein n=1 Tax=Auriscalpium vulgare TaxID=40419 RepID=A0ACB8RLU4_9AGAM|nr:hypothetical protein FA95DRAFT_1561367 [Auriscalpium vulgare]